MNITSSSSIAYSAITSSNYGSSGGSSTATSASSSSTQTQGSKGPRRFDEATRQAAEAKLASTDPGLAKKLEDFHSQIDKMRQGGASQSDVASAMKSNMDSLSDTEKSELKSVFGAPSSDASSTYDPLSQLKQTDSALAKKLEDFKSQTDELSSSGASDDAIAAAMKKNMDSLSQSEKSEMQKAFGKGHHGGPPPPRPSGSDSSSTSSATATSTSKSESTWLKSLLSANTYSQSQSLLDNSRATSFSYAA